MAQTEVQIDSRVRISLSAEFYNRITTDTDAPGMGTHDSASVYDLLSKGLGGVFDYKFESDADLSGLNDTSKIVTATGSAGTVIGSGPIADWIFIKHTGYTSADKTTATAETSELRVGLGTSSISSGALVVGFMINSGGAMLLPKLGTSCNDLGAVSYTHLTLPTNREV